MDKFTAKGNWPREEGVDKGKGGDTEEKKPQERISRQHQTW